MQIYSHPSENGRDKVLLENHLEDAATRVDHVVADDATTPNGEPLRQVVQTLAYVHDLGKATTYFQQYIDIQSGSVENPHLRHHSLLGAFAAYYALNTRGYTEETCLAGFVAVAKHHGRLPDVANYVHERTYRRDGVSDDRKDSDERRQDAIGEQAADIHEHAPTLAREILGRATDGRGDWAAFFGSLGDILEDVSSIVSDGPHVDRESISRDCYATVLRCWSTLTLVDKTSAAGADPAEYEATEPHLERLDEHVASLEAAGNPDPDGSREERLNYHRSRARESVLNQVASFADDGGGVATLTLPTGMGKTLTGLSAAFDLRERLGGERVIYALPFTSIIDQVVDDIASIYDVDATGSLLTAHHHLAETTIEDASDTETADANDGVAGMLAESWRAGLTVTTFVQLFESLAGPQNGQSLKLPAFQNSIVVLDEPQSLPLDWWKLAPRLVEIITQEYDATVIAMTATQPQLFEKTTYIDEAMELVGDPESYFDVERVAYELDGSTERYLAGGSERESGGKPYDEAASELCSIVDSEQSVLAVCNTIDSTRKLTDNVAEQSPKVTDVAEVYTVHLQAAGHPDEVDASRVARGVAAQPGPALLHLSTRLRPADRLTLIEVAKRLTEAGESVVAVTTQLVEAGVDISFNCVYRDLAPIDSIVQAAGRCNRSFERERGTVVVWWLAVPDEQQKTPAEAVYNAGTSLLPVTATALDSVRDQSDGLSETTVARDAICRYYEILHEDRDVGEQTYVDDLDEARVDRLADRSLIDQRRTADILVSRTDADRKRVNAIRTALDDYEYDALDKHLDESKPLRLSIPLYDDETEDAISRLNPIRKEDGLYELDVRQQGDFFDERTGFIVPESSVTHQFL